MPLKKSIVDVDGNPISDIFVPKGTTVYCNIAAVNTDPAIWGADAKKWNPERWLNPLPDSVIEAHIPGIYTNMSAQTLLLGSFLAHALHAGLPLLVVHAHACKIYVYPRTIEQWLIVLSVASNSHSSR